jgi:hypothetical protein
LLRPAVKGSERLPSVYAQVDQAEPVATVTSQSVALREAALPPNMVCAFGN